MSKSRGRPRIVGDKILKLLRENASLTPADIHRALDKKHTVWGIMYNLKILEELGLIDHYGDTSKNKRYYLKEWNERQSLIEHMHEFIKKRIGVKRRIEGKLDVISHDDILKIEHVWADGLYKAYCTLIEIFVDRGVELEDE